MRLPAPPLLKTTIIQLNKDIDPDDNNYEILTNEYSGGGSAALAPAAPQDEQPRKKRRRSLLFVDDEELARRKTETKQLHLIIEKRRRIKINREFEALKYLIPACRNTDSGAKRGASSNGNKIDGMYKLTILKLLVEYILYLHHIVQQQHQMLAQQVPEYNYDVSFSAVPLDVNQYRNIDKDFDFSELAASAAPPPPQLQKFRFEPIQEEAAKPPHNPQNVPRAKSDTYASAKSSQLPTPGVTPDIAPILSLLSKYTNDTQLQQQILQQKLQRPQHDLDQLSKTFSFDTVRQLSGLVSNSTSPFTIPIKLLVKKTSFYLPDPALPSSLPLDLPPPNADSPNLSKPKKMFFKTRVPPNNMVAEISEPAKEGDDGERREDASRALLTLRKPSMEMLLN